MHAVRSGQSLYWLILLFSFPLLGSVVQFLAIYFPEVRHSHGVRQVFRSAKQLMDPGQDLRNARESRTPTLQNRVCLGMTLLDAGQTEEARTLLEQAASSPLGDDPNILTGLARARLDSGHAALAAETLDGLFARYPDARRKPEQTLLYAQALAATPAPETRAAFERAVECGNDAAVRCLFAEWLMAQPQLADREQARSLFASIIDDAQHWSRHARSHNAAWLERTKVALKGYWRLTASCNPVASAPLMAPPGGCRQPAGGHSRHRP
ncbi:tetratricopeptide repeat protein [Stenotrophomonas indicatrix]|uniref:tetratricopeptide repeat protein n=1 Tax=Stenotrophomonas indicatrix TaxID=2045451 RepID=UPI0020047B30